MVEYIEREKAIANSREYNLGGSYDNTELAVPVDAINSIPVADVRPVVRGKWELDSDPGEPWRYVCNICGEKTKDTVMGKPRANFCPNFGADMRGEAE